MAKRWGDQWWWRVDVVFKDNKGNERHHHLTLETAKSIERRMKSRKDVKKVTKSREGKREG